MPKPTQPVQDPLFEPAAESFRAPEPGTVRLASGPGLTWLTHVYAWHSDLLAAAGDYDSEELGPLIGTLMEDLQAEVDARLPEGAQWRPHQGCIVGDRPVTTRLTPADVNAILNQARAEVSSHCLLLTGEEDDTEVAQAS